LETPDFLVIGAGAAGLRAAIEVSQAGTVLVKDSLRESSLEQALREDAPLLSLAMDELRNIHTEALLIARCALGREESRGTRYRPDFAESRAEFGKHSFISRGNAVTFR
jgi:succinate dehydrogenase/fumarate reductase flavoprotein subunit